MTKYILNSGGLSNNPEKAKAFYAEMVKGLGDTPKILFCSFAQPREDWDGSYRKTLENLHMLFPQGVEPMLELAMPATFKEQVEKADIILIKGGDDTLLQYYLKQYNLPALWENKVVATSSAGSNAMVKHFWTCDWRECKNGLGLVPIKFISHYDSDYGSNDSRGPIDWESGYKELETYGEPLPIHTPRETEYVVIEQ